MWSSLKVDAFFHEVPSEFLRNTSTGHWEIPTVVSQYRILLQLAEITSSEPLASYSSSFVLLGLPVAPGDPLGWSPIPQLAVSLVNGNLLQLLAISLSQAALSSFSPADFFRYHPLCVRLNNSLLKDVHTLILRSCD